MAIPTNFRDSSPVDDVQYPKYPFRNFNSITRNERIVFNFYSGYLHLYGKYRIHHHREFDSMKIKLFIPEIRFEFHKNSLHRASIGGFTVRAGSRRARNAFHTIAHIFLFACNLRPRYFLEIMKMGMRYIFSIPMGREGNE